MKMLRKVTQPQDTPSPTAQFAGGQLTSATGTAIASKARGSINHGIRPARNWSTWASPVSNPRLFEHWYLEHQ